MCLIIKSGSKMVENSKTLCENEIHRVDIPSNKDFKNIIFCQGGSSFGKKRRENLGEMAKNREIYCFANYNKEYWPLLVLNGIRTFALVFLHVGSNYLLKAEEVSFQAKFCPSFAALSSLNVGTFFEFDN